MEINFSQENPRNLKDAVKTDNPVSVKTGDRPVEALYNGSKALNKYSHWSNIGISNRKECWIDYQNNDEFELEFEIPDYNFSNLRYMLKHLKMVANTLTEREIREYSLEEIGSRELGKIFANIIEEQLLRVELMESVEDRGEWLELCNKIWTPPEKDLVEKAEKNVDELSSEKDGEIVPVEKVKELCVEEIENLGFDWDVEIQEVVGSHNVPEKQKLIISSGRNGERVYTRDEARIIAVHEVFHAARAFNGYRTVEGTGLPPVTGFSTGFYDETEEGGAVLREQEADVGKEWKQKDYYLRIIAVRSLIDGKTVLETGKELEKYGATERRGFELAVRNRQILRHQIYLSGQKDWENTGEELMTGKVNPDIAEIIWREVEDGNFNEPQVSHEQIFADREF